MAKKKAQSRRKKTTSKVRVVNPEIVDEKAPSHPETPEATEDYEVLPPTHSLSGQVDPNTSEPTSSALTRGDLIDRYLAEIKKYPLLSKEEERAIAKLYYDTKDPKAAEQLVTANLRFVVKIAAEYTRFGARLIDLIQEGNVGLMHAVKEFNPYKGVRLITYAVWWIRGYIQEYLMRQYSMVRIGTTAAQRKLFYELQRQKDDLEKMGYGQAVKQISGRLDVNEKDVTNMQQRLQGRDISLDQPINNDESAAKLMDFQSSTTDEPLDDALAHQEQLALLKEKIDAIRPSLNEKELFLLEERLLADEPLTLQEIGDKYSTTREAVRQMEVRVLQKIKNLLVSKENKDSR